MYFAFRLCAIGLMLAGVAQTALAQGSVTVSPSPLILCGQPNQAVSGAPLFISTSAAALTVISTGVTSEGDWLQLEPSFATVTAGQPFQLLVGINTGGQSGAPLYNSIIPFGNGEYTGQIILSGVNGAKLATVPVLLRISAAGCGASNSGAIYSSSGPVAFQIPPNASAGVTLSIFNSFRTNVTAVSESSTGTAQKWITSLNNAFYIVNGPMYPTPFVLGVTSDGLSPGATYSGNIEFDASSFSILNLPVTLNVSAAAGGARFAVTPSPLSIAIRKDTAATGVNVTLTNLTPAAVGISVTPTVVNGRNWLAVSPSSLVLQANETTVFAANIAASGLSGGVNKGSLNVQVTTGSTGSLTIPVTVQYGIGSELSAAPNPVNLTVPAGASNPVEDVIAISSNSGVVSFTAKVFSSTTQPWLSVKPSFSTVSPGAPVNLTIGVNPALLPIGPAVGIISLVRSDGAGLTIPVNVNSGRDTALTVTPAQISFAFPVGSPFPQTQTLSLTSATPTSYTVQATTSGGGKWLNATPNTIMAGTAGDPAKVTVQVNPAGLAPNTYQGQVAITNANSGTQQIVTVILSVGPALPVSTNPTSLTFNYEAGSPITPQAQSVQVASTGGSSQFTAAASGLNGAPDFLSLDSLGGNTPATLSVRLNAASLATLGIGEYQGAVTIFSPGFSGGSQMVKVTLIVTPPSPRVAALVSSASLAPGPVSPGEMVTIFGSGLAGAAAAFDGYPAPLIYVGAGQINAVAPYQIAGGAVTNLVISRNGVTSAPLTLQVVDTAPAIFSATQNGNGQGAILNADNSYNSVSNPAAKGSVIQIFATGEGVYPGAVTGSVITAQPPFPVLSNPVRVTIGGIPADLQYFSEAPGLLSGVLQVNAVVPQNAGSGPLKVVLTVGENSNSSQSITVAVQ